MGADHVRQNRVFFVFLFFYVRRYDCIDTVGVDMQPKFNANPAYGLYFIVFIIVCAYFCTNLFIGAIADTFMKLSKEESSSSVLLTDAQKKFVDVQKAMMKRQPSNR
jgi:voltage-dependent calcium channel L type alpha-1D